MRIASSYIGTVLLRMAHPHNISCIKFNCASEAPVILMPYSEQFKSKKMKTINIIIMVILITFTVTSCKKDTTETMSNSPGMSDVAETDNEPVPLRGNIKNHQNVPISGAIVYLYKIVSTTTTLIDSTTSDTFGAFVFNAVYFGDYRVTIVANGYDTANINCSMPLTATELDLGDIILE